MAEIKVVGNLGNDPETKSFQGNNGTFNVASFSIGETPREKNKFTGEWEDGTTTWYRVSLVGKLAELASGLAKGQKVIVVGEFKQSNYTTKAGEQKQSLEIKASNIGVVPRVERKSVSGFATEEDATGW